MFWETPSDVVAITHKLQLALRINLVIKLVVAGCFPEDQNTLTSNDTISAAFVMTPAND